LPLNDMKGREGATGGTLAPTVENTESTMNTMTMRARARLELIGRSPEIVSLQEEIERVARSDAKVLITGESGVGKEVVAKSIHEQSTRSRQPLVTINYAGIPDTLLASELFGHTRGSFTDAHKERKGYLEQAHRGTVFLDEVGEMSLQMQALLLRFLENGEIQRVGSESRNM